MMKILADIDCVLMLTWSDWYKEMRSNRYHYASRFAKHVPVIFVQPDLNSKNYRIHPTETDNVFVLRLYKRYDFKQADLLNQALTRLGYIRPMIWIYNCHFTKFLESRFSLYTIYHATEDYFSKDSPLCLNDAISRKNFQETFAHCNQIICVSDGVKESLEPEFSDFISVITNGCDYNFYEPQLEGYFDRKINKKIAFYQGNIFDKLDFALLIKLAQGLPDWEFHFCGKIITRSPEWQFLLTLPNVKYLGVLSPESLREYAQKLTVGIIPFKDDEWLTKRSFPLKAFEYLACGLPVVSTPIEALATFSTMFYFASSYEDFAQGLQNAHSEPDSGSKLLKRLNYAKTQDYDLKFAQLISDIDKARMSRVNISELNCGIFSLENHFTPQLLKRMVGKRYTTIHFSLSNLLKALDFQPFNIAIFIVNLDNETDRKMMVFGQELSKVGIYKILIMQSNNTNKFLCKNAKRFVQESNFQHIFLSSDLLDEVSTVSTSATLHGLTECHTLNAQIDCIIDNIDMDTKFINNHKQLILTLLGHKVGSISYSNFKFGSLVPNQDINLDLTSMNFYFSNIKTKLDTLIAKLPSFLVNKIPLWAVRRVFDYIPNSLKAKLRAIRLE